MSNSLGGLFATDEKRKIGPDFFGYYASEVKELLSQDEDSLPCSDQTIVEPIGRYREGRNENAEQCSTHVSDSLFSNGIEAGLSYFQTQRLKSLLRQGVSVLSSEVDETLDAVVGMCRLQSRLQREGHFSSHTSASPDADEGVSCKKQKLSSLLSSRRRHGHSRPPNSGVGRKVDSDLRFLLENDRVLVEETVKKYSNELSVTLDQMEHQLESLLDAVTSKCRPMTLAEKQQLQKLIQKLPPKNLNRIAEIIQRGKPAGTQSCDEIHVDLEQEDNSTLWRLYYYVEVVDNVK